MRRNICLSSGSLCRFPETQEVVCRVPVLTSIAHWLHQIKFLPFNFYHRFLQWALSTPTPHLLLSRRPRHLRWCWCVYWIVSRRAFSNEIIISTSASVFFRLCRLPIKLLRLQCIFLAFEVLLKKSNILNHLHWDSLLLGDKPGSPDLFAFILLSSAQNCPWDVVICSSHFCL